MEPYGQEKVEYAMQFIHKSKLIPRNKLLRAYKANLTAVSDKDFKTFNEKVKWKVIKGQITKFGNTTPSGKVSKYADWEYTIRNLTEKDINKIIDELELLMNLNK